MKGKHKPKASIYLNEEVKAELLWFIKHIRESSGILLFEGMDWDPLTECDMSIYCDACLSGMGYWIPELLLGFYAPVPLERRERHIFFFEALCVVAAIRWYCHSMRSDASLTRRLHLVVYTDSQNTVDIFNSLHARPEYNLLLRCSIDDLIAFDVDIRVRHIKGEDNVVADALSRRHFSKATSLCPGLVINFFTPPRDALGEKAS